MLEIVAMKNVHQIMPKLCKQQEISGLESTIIGVAKRSSRLEFFEVRKIIKREFSKEIEEIFESFDEKPIGCASIGQVYRATLNGEKVAVKIQQIGIEKQFRCDLKNLKNFCRFAFPEYVTALEEIENQFYFKKLLDVLLYLEYLYLKYLYILYHHYMLRS